MSDTKSQENQDTTNYQSESVSNPDNHHDEEEFDKPTQTPERRLSTLEGLRSSFSKFRQASVQSPLADRSKTLSSEI